MVGRNGRKIIFLSIIIFSVLSISILYNYFFSNQQSVELSKTVSIDLFKDTDTVRNGDLICRLGNGVFTRYFMEMGSDDGSFSHIGILFKDSGIWYVFHTEANEITGVGGVKKERLPDFLESSKNAKIFNVDVDDSIRERMIQISNYHLNNSTAFDLNFDLYTDDELYCTEFVAKTINQSFGKNIIFPTLQIKEKLFFSLDDIYKNNIVK